jgi:NADPH2:quinone reductase
MTGFLLILNSVAGETFGRDFELLAPLGQIVWFGMAAGPPGENLTELLAAGFGKSAGIRTFVLYSMYDLDPRLTAQSFELLLGYLAKGKIKPRIHEQLPLSEAARAHELLESGVVKGKLVLKP